MLKRNDNPKLLAHLVRKGKFIEDPFSLIDVGCSGGIEPYWRVFEPSLKAVGFDPLTKEVERLNREEQNRAVRYEPVSIGYRRYPEMVPSHPVPNSKLYYRSSSIRAQKLLDLQYAETYFDKTNSGIRSTEMIELDEYFDHDGKIDFIKIDTDGHDYEVLLGAERLLETALLGLIVEAPFTGDLWDGATLFSNIDRFLQQRGFSLFHLEPRWYSRASLPKRFRWQQPADTFDGQVSWADCLYLRDAASENYEKTWDVTLSALKLVKLVCTYELFRLEDCAAEILVKFTDQLEAYLDVETSLDMLTPPLPDGRQVSYREYNQFFDQNPEAFYER